MLTKRKIEYFVKHGTRYEATICPGIIIRGRVGDCFDASLMNVLVNGFTYVEGIAKNPLNGEWIHHAWVTDGTGKAYDPTWKLLKHGVEVLLPTEYIGIPLKTKPLIAFIRETEYKGLFENGWRNPMHFAQALPDNVPVFKFIPEQDMPVMEPHLPDRPINHERD